MLQFVDALPFLPGLCFQTRAKWTLSCHEAAIKRVEGVLEYFFANLIKLWRAWGWGV